MRPAFPPIPETVPASVKSFPIVGLGASAGGLEALEKFLSLVPPDGGMAFVVVTHQHPGHVSLLPELLGKCTQMPVMAAADGILVKPKHRLHVHCRTATSPFCKAHAAPHGAGRGWVVAAAD